MVKKKVVGILVFTIIISFYLNYPNLQEWRLERQVNAMIENGQYGRVYTLLSDSSMDPSHRQFMNLMKANVALDTDDTRLMINRLVANRDLDTLQLLVDEFGIKLGNNLALIDYMDGIVYDDESSDYLARYHLNRRNMDRAMALRGETDEIDLIYLTYLATQGDLAELLQIYEDVPEDLKETYYNLITHDIIFVGLNQRSTGYPQTEAAFLTELQSYEYPEEVLFRIGRHYVDSHFFGQANSLEHPFFTENIYFQFYREVAGLNDPTKREESLRLLKDDQFNSFPSRDRLLQLAENGTNVREMIEVSKGGIFHYTYNSGAHISPQNYIYNFNNGTEERVNLERYSDYSVSPNREHILERRILGLGGRFIVLDEYFNTKNTIDKRHNPTTQVDYWVNDWEVVLVNTKTFKRQVLNVETGDIREFAGERPYTHGFEPVVQGTSLWAINEERYIGLEPHDKGLHYVIRERISHKEIKSIPLEFEFIGSCTQYIYGISTEDEFLKILVRQCINTGRIEELPFFSISSHGGFPRFVIY